MNSESALWTIGQLSLLFKWLIQELWAWEILQDFHMTLLNTITKHMKWLSQNTYRMTFLKLVETSDFLKIAWDMSLYDSQQLKILRTLLLNILASLFRQGKYHWGLYVVLHLIEIIVLMTMKLMKVMKVDTSACYVSDITILRIFHI